MELGRYLENKRSSLRRPDAGLRLTTLKLCGAILALASLVAPSASMAEDAVKLTPAQAQSLGVRTIHPVASRSDQTLPYPAQIVIPTTQQWVVSAPVAGMVNSISVARGDRVRAGLPLLTLESPSFVSLQREYLHAVAQDELAAQQLKRNMDLYEGKAVPQRVLEASQSQARQASIAVAERKQMLRLSGLSDVAIGKLTSEAAISATLSVAAPQSATVLELVVGPGQRVEQSAPLVKLAQLSPLWIEIAVPAASVRAIKPGAAVVVEAYPTPGRVILVSETADAATQTVLVRAEVPNSGELRPGQHIEARIGFVSSDEGAWEIPYSALIRRGEQASVFVAVQDGFRLAPVSVLAEDQEHVVVSGDFNDKDRVAISGISALRGILLHLGTE